jgi:hypothetical protein
VLEPYIPVLVDSPKKINSNLKEKITTAIAEMVVKDYLPLSFVEGDGFLNLMNIIVPEYKVPTRNTIKSRIGKLFELQLYMIDQIFCTTTKC